MPRPTHAATLKFYLLGSLRVEGAKGPLNLPARKAQSLLAYLVLHPEEHTREKLAAFFLG
jgi:DNA-binding SARP family transcriptional activator